MTQSQGAIWKQVTQAYNQWDPDREKLMPVKELHARLPMVEPGLIDDVVAQAASEHLADIGDADDDREFRPLQEQ